MFHITHFLLVLSLAVGVAAIGVSAEMYRRYRLGFLRSHLAIVIVFNLMIFLSMIALYVSGLPRGTLSSGAVNGVGMGYGFITPLLQLLAAYFFLQIIRGLLGRPVPDKVRSIGWAVLGAYTALQVTAMAASVRVGDAPLSLGVGRAAWFFSLGAIYVMLVSHLPQVGRVEDIGRRKALRAYWSLIMGLMTAIIVLILLNNTGILEIDKYNLVSGAMILAMNAIPVLYLRWFAARFHGRPKAEEETPAPGADLFARYNISPREQEIVNLICKGKTNGEIADELFISLQTVKDHVYRIYRKTDVKNRVQLVTLFMRDDS
jgi:DNA-binding CsgD family transcriptional regulator